MKTLYVDCGMGAAGDMLSAALLELLEENNDFISQFNALGLSGVIVLEEKMSKCGILGTHISVNIHGEEEHKHHHEHHHHSSMHEIEHIVHDLELSEEIKKDILCVYRIIAEAESRVHGVPVTEIHFHEVGMMDAIADITMVCMLMNRIAPERVVVSPVHVGSGHVHCAHGILPVPAPATALILQNIPIYGGGIKGELCTPTGAALLKHFATEFREMPVMNVERIGYGMGTKNFEQANCVRVMLGECEDKKEDIYELSCNVDDMTGEEIGFAVDKLLKAGVLEVFSTPVYMKKNRPGTLLTILCREEKREELVKVIFQYTTTLGIREKKNGRYALQRSVETEETEFGPVRKKISQGYGVKREKYEYDDLADIAEKKEISLNEVKRRI